MCVPRGCVNTLDEFVGLRTQPLSQRRLRLGTTSIVLHENTADDTHICSEL